MLNVFVTQAEVLAFLLIMNGPQAHAIAEATIWFPNCLDHLLLISGYAHPQPLLASAGEIGRCHSFVNVVLVERGPLALAVSRAVLCEEVGAVSVRRLVDLGNDCVGGCVVL